MDLTKVQIQTKRLLLVPISPKFRQSIFENFTKDISKYLLAQPSTKKKDIDIFIKRSIKQIKKSTSLILVITTKQTKEFLGIVSLNHINRRTPVFGIWLKKEAHGKKIGKEAAKGLKEWADKNILFSYLKYSAFPKNIPSRKIAESIGGKLIHEVTIFTNNKKIKTVEYFIYPKQ